MIEATVETFDDLVREGEVLVDIWGPQCQPCLALMPAVEGMPQSRNERVASAPWRFSSSSDDIRRRCATPRAV